MQKELKSIPCSVDIDHASWHIINKWFSDLLFSMSGLIGLFVAHLRREKKEVTTSICTINRRSINQTKNNNNNNQRSWLPSTESTIV